MTLYTEYSRNLYVIGAIDAILRTNSKEQTVDSIKKILEGVKEIVENN